MAYPTDFGATSLIEFYYKVMASELGITSPTPKENYFKGFRFFIGTLKSCFTDLTAKKQLTSLEGMRTLTVEVNNYQSKTITFNGKDDLNDYFELHNKISLIIEMNGCEDFIDRITASMIFEEICKQVSKKLNECDVYFSIMEFIFENADRDDLHFKDIWSYNLKHAREFFSLSVERVNKLEAILGFKLQHLEAESTQ